MQLQTNKEQKEIKQHGSYAFPFRISYERLSNFETGSFSWHWHPEIELTLVREGSISYQVNEKIYPLRAAQGLFCNSNMLHTGHRLESEDCSYLSITFHPRLLYGYHSSIMENKYVHSILNSPACSSICFTPDIPWQKHVLELIEHIRLLSATPPHSGELQIQIALMTIWQEIFDHAEVTENENQKPNKDTTRIRQIIEYIQMHYQENITLEQLSNHVHLCSNETCRMFKRCMKQTIFDYLIHYRIERSLEYIQQTDMSITQISDLVGFATPNYFSRVFKKDIGCTPMEYRKKGQITLS